MEFGYINNCTDIDELNNRLRKIQDSLNREDAKLDEKKLKLSRLERHMEFLKYSINCAYDNNDEDIQEDGFELYEYIAKDKSYVEADISYVDLLIKELNDEINMITDRLSWLCSPSDEGEDF